MPQAPRGWTWEACMREALAEADVAKAQGEVPVGALLLDFEGCVLGRGHNTCIRDCDPTAHAEVNAIRAACRARANYRLPNTVLVVTLEPCILCTAACCASRVQGLVFGACDAVAGCVCTPEGPFAKTLGTKLWYMGGVLGEECAAYLTDFFALRRSG